MSAFSAPTTPPTALEIFTARCQARAALYADGEIPDLHEAVDVVQAHAVKHGLAAQFGQDEIQRMMAEAFQPVREVP